MSKRARRSQTRFARKVVPAAIKQMEAAFSVGRPRARLGRPDKFYADYGLQFAGRRLRRAPLITILRSA